VSPTLYTTNTITVASKLVTG